MTRGRSRLLVHALDAGLLGDGIDALFSDRLLDALSARAVLLAEPGDTVLVDRAPDPRWLALLDRIGYGSVTIVAPELGEGALVDRTIADRALCERISAACGFIDPYMASAPMRKLAHTLGLELRASDPELVRSLNLKSSLGSVLEAAGVETISTETCPRDGVRPCVERMRAEHGAVIVRADVSIGGYGVWTIGSDRDMDRLERGLARSDPDRLFLVQPLIDVTSSPNAQYRIEKGRAPELLGITDQHITEEMAFIGNTCPSVSASDPLVIEQGNRIAAHLQRSGYVGLVGIDFIVASGRDAQSGVYAIEINPRVNTSTFAFALAHRTGSGAFVLKTGIPCGHDPLDAGPGVLFDPDLGEGMVPITLPLEGRPKFDAAFLAPTLDRAREHAERYESLIESAATER